MRVNILHSFIGRVILKVYNPESQWIVSERVRANLKQPEAEVQFNKL